MITLKETAMALSVAMMSFCSLHAATGDGYAKRFAIKPGRALGLSANASLEDFPVLVRLSSDIRDFSYDDFEKAELQEGETVPSSLDILFVDRGGTILPYEIQVWNPDGVSLVWVKVPALTQSTYITCYIGNADATAVNTPASTWSAYAGAWHFDEVGEGGTSADSSATALTGTCYSVSASTTGIASGAGDPLGAGGYRENVGNRTLQEGDLANGTGSGVVFEGSQYLHPSDATHFTVSAWFRRNVTGAGWDHLFYKKNDSRGNNTDGKDWGQEINGYGDGSTADVFGLWESSNGVNLRHGIDSADIWYYVSIVYDGYARRIYNNGVEISSGEIDSDKSWFLSTWDREDVKMTLGNESDQDGVPFQGSFDEARLRFAAYDADWAKAEYETMANANSLVYSAVVGPDVEADDLFGPDAAPTKIWLEASGVPGEEPLVDFPVMIRLREGERRFSHADFSDGNGDPDVTFADEHGNVLTHEIEQWNVSGETVIWVKIPSLVNGMRIRMYSGGPMQDVDTTAIWSAYKGVWHLNEPAGATTFANAQGYYMDGIDHGTAYAAGIAGPARRISDGVKGAADGHNIEIPNKDEPGVGYVNQRVFNDNSAHNAFSMWIKYPSDQTPGNDRLVCQQWQDTDSMGWMVRLSGNSTQLVTSCGGNASASDSVFGNLCDGEWHHLVVVYDGTSRYIYTDGELRARMTGVAAISGDWNWQPMGWGGYVIPDNNPVSFKGWMDELRFAAGLYPAPAEKDGGVYEAPQLVKAEYLNVKKGFFALRYYGLTITVR